MLSGFELKCSRETRDLLTPNACKSLTKQRWENKRETSHGSKHWPREAKLKRTGLAKGKFCAKFGPGPFIYVRPAGGPENYLC